MNWSLKITIHVTIIETNFSKYLATTTKQWQLYYFQMKCGFICQDMLIPKITVSGQQIISMFLKKLHYTQLKSASSLQFLNIESSVQFFW